MWGFQKARPLQGGEGGVKVAENKVGWGTLAWVPEQAKLTHRGE